MTIKPGDLVFHRAANTTHQVITVDYDRGRMILGILPDGYRNADDCDLRTACSPDVERTIVLQYQHGPATSRTRWCKAEALRRGWRPIESTDVTTIAMEEQLLVDQHSIGSIATLDGHWHWLLEGEEADAHPPVATKAEAFAAVVDGANARRAEPSTVATTKEGVAGDVVRFAKVL